jgi:DNA-binding MarR family transcriptional regulator
MFVDPLKSFPGYALRRASAASMAKLSRKLSSVKLRPSEATVLLVIESNPEITQSEIGQALDIAGANMAPLVGRLAEREVIERRPVDGRSQGLRLTDSGRALAQRAKRIMQTHEDELLGKIPRSQRTLFLECLRALWSGEEE